MLNYMFFKIRLVYQYIIDNTRMQQMDKRKPKSKIQHLLNRIKSEVVQPPNIYNKFIQPTTDEQLQYFHRINEE